MFSNFTVCTSQNSKRLFHPFSGHPHPHPQQFRSLISWCFCWIVGEEQFLTGLSQNNLSGFPNKKWWKWPEEMIFDSNMPIVLVKEMSVARSQAFICPLMVASVTNVKGFDRENSIFNKLVSDVAGSREMDEPLQRKLDGQQMFLFLTWTWSRISLLQCFWFSNSCLVASVFNFPKHVEKILLFHFSKFLQFYFFNLLI